MSSHLLAWWLAVGLVGSSATAWRLPGLPLGFGELVMLGWLIVEWGRRFNDGKFRLHGTHWRSSPLDAVALLVTLGALAAAQIWAILVGQFAWYAQRDFVAIILAGGLALTLSSMRDREEFSQLLVMAFFWIAVGFSSLLLLHTAIGVFFGGPLLTFSSTFGTRFLGLATNPNQFALFSLTLPICLGLAWMRYKGATRCLGVVLGLLALLAGLATQSDALALVWMILAISALGVYLYPLYNKSAIQRPALVVAFSISLAFLGWSQIPQFVTNRTGTGGWTTTLAKAIEEERLVNPYQQNQVGNRLALYENGIRAWLDSPWVGHGVQMVSGLTGPYQGNESHNTLIDWLTFAGVLGMLPLLAWSVLLVSGAWRRRNLLGLGALLAGAAFAQFGLYARHPLFWVLACAFAFLPGQLPGSRGSR